MEHKIKDLLALANRDEIVTKIVGGEIEWEELNFVLVDITEHKLSFLNNKTQKTKIVVIKEYFPDHYIFALFLRGRFKGIVPMFEEKAELEKYISFLRRYYLSLKKEKRELWLSSINKMEEVGKFLFNLRQRQKGAAK